MTCTVCGSQGATVQRGDTIEEELVDCDRCGMYQTSRFAADAVNLPFKDPKRAALASHVIRQMQTAGARPKLTRPFFDSLNTRSLPTPAGASDNLLLFLADQADGRPGVKITSEHSDPALIATVGVVEPADLAWVVQSLKDKGLIDGGVAAGNSVVRLTIIGWERVEKLKLALTSSRFAFFARKFANAELDIVFFMCLRPAIEQTGYELRTVMQKAGLVDAIIEDEIRRCRFLIADLSDSNAGAYWEAGFAEGLGKPVIYVCRKGSDVHFDADHRHTVKWDLAALDETARNLKAVIRNTLLGDAKQDD